MENSNSIARTKIATLYNLVVKFRMETLNPILNSELSKACKDVPGFEQLNDQLYKLLMDFELKVIKFADDNYPRV